jgi:hypothetical protein
VPVQSGPFPSLEFQGVKFVGLAYQGKDIGFFSLERLVNFH